jgi:hypothetical protein
MLAKRAAGIELPAGSGALLHDERSTPAWCTPSDLCPSEFLPPQPAI